MINSKGNLRENLAEEKSTDVAEMVTHSSRQRPAPTPIYSIITLDAIPNNIVHLCTFHRNLEDVITCYL
jgi:hypothetical protein